MKVGFDIDGVFVDFANEIFLAALFDLTGIIPNNTVPYSWDYSESFGISEEIEEQVWNSDELLHHMEKALPIPGSLILPKMFPDHVFVTSRGTSHNAERAQRIREITFEWVRWRLQLDAPIFFSPCSQKHTLLRQHGAEIMVEDNPIAVELMASSGIRVLMPVYPYNEHVFHANVLRISLT